MYLIGTLSFADLGSFLGEIARNQVFQDALELQKPSRIAAGCPRVVQDAQGKILKNRDLSPAQLFA